MCVHCLLDILQVPMRKKIREKEIIIFWLLNIHSLYITK